MKASQSSKPRTVSRPVAGSTRITTTVLGCGTSTGVPMLFCSCKVCRSRDPKNKRLRASVWIQVAGQNFLIDTSTDLRQQALRARIPRVDAVLYTHPHADHIHGIDELRSFNFIQKAPIPLYGNDWTCCELRQKMGYIFDPKPIEGGGIPLLTLTEVPNTAQAFEINGVKIQPLPLKHGSRDCLGYRINSVAYVTDCSYIPEGTLEQMQGLSVLWLDCLRIAPHGTHLNLEQALNVIERVKPQRTFLTHLSHDFEYAVWQKKLPPGVALAYDGLKITAQYKEHP